MKNPWICFTHSGLRLRVNLKNMKWQSLQWSWCDKVYLYSMITFYLAQAVFMNKLFLYNLWSYSLGARGFLLHLCGAPNLPKHKNGDAKNKSFFFPLLPTVRNWTFGGSTMLDICIKNLSSSQGVVAVMETIIKVEYTLSV